MAASPSHASPTRRIPWLQCLLGVIPLLLLPPAWSLRPIWVLDQKSFVVLGLTVIAYAAIILSLRHGELHGRRASLWRVLAVGAAAFAPVLLVVVLWHPQFSRFALLASPALALGLAWFAFTLRGFEGLRLAAVAALGLVAIAIQAGAATGVLARPEPKRWVENFRVHSALYELAVTAYREWVPRTLAIQGGITRFADRYLLMTGDGELYLFDRKTEGAPTLEIQRLAYSVPMNRDEFAEATAGLPVVLNWFRAADVLSHDTAQGTRVYATHHFWKKDQKCYVLRVSMLEGRAEDFSADSAVIAWKTLYETTPCVPVVAEGRETKFGGIDNGGRMTLVSERELLVAIGDHLLDAWDGEEPAQDQNSAFGKTVLINLDDQSSRIFTLGHRSTQGLFATSGAIWLTEHGPQGGDELNLLREGANYGWPMVTYGVAYGTHSWPRAVEQGSHAGFVRPYYSWVPSIGVSSLLEVTSPMFETWQGDLLVSSLAARALWRLRIREDRVVMAEQISLGHRIREIILGHRGELVLWTDPNTLMFIEPAPPSEVSGEQLYLMCAGCHVAAQGQRTAIGPNLQGIVGRPVAADEDFEYSQSMRSLSGTWTKERLDAFLENPYAVAPGTSMQFPGIADQGSRDLLIEYMAAPDRRLDVAPVPLFVEGR